MSNNINLPIPKKYGAINLYKTINTNEECVILNHYTIFFFLACFSVVSFIRSSKFIFEVASFSINVIESNTSHSWKMRD